MNDHHDLIAEILSENIHDIIDNEILNCVFEELRVGYEIQFLYDIIKSESDQLDLNDKSV